MRLQWIWPARRVRNFLTRSWGEYCPTGPAGTREPTRAITTKPTKKRERKPRPRESDTVIRLFKVYYPMRTLVLLAGEALIVWVSFLLGTLLQNRDDSWLQYTVDGGRRMRTV